MSTPDAAGYLTLIASQPVGDGTLHSLHLPMREPEPLPEPEPVAEL